MAELSRAVIQVLELIEEALDFQEKVELFNYLQENILDEKVAATVEELLPDAIQAALSKFVIAIP